MFKIKKTQQQKFKESRWSTNKYATSLVLSCAPSVSWSTVSQLSKHRRNDKHSAFVQYFSSDTRQTKLLCWRSDVCEESFRVTHSHAWLHISADWSNKYFFVLP